MTSLAYTFSPPTKPAAAPTAVINKGDDMAARAGGEGVPFDVFSNTSVGSVNRSVGAPVGGGESLRNNGSRRSGRCGTLLFVDIIICGQHYFVCRR